MKNAIFCSAITLLFSLFMDAHAASSDGVSIGPVKSERQLPKRENASVTPWGKLDLKSFLSLKEWKDEIEVRETVPDWEKIRRERDTHEIVGRLYQCVGICRVDRGESFFSASHRTLIYEGDELQTIGDSYAWIFLYDGTMVRLSPSSSVTFNELNIGVKENFVNARINAGNVLWLSRHENLFEEVNIRETDMIFFPYAEYESLPVADKKPYIEDDLIVLLGEKKTYLNHYKMLNEKISVNNLWTLKKPSYAFLIMPNATVMGTSLSVEIVTLLGGKSFVKNRSAETLGLIKTEGETPKEVYLQLRGYENKELAPLQEDQWIAIDERGRSVAPENDMHWLNVGQFITKRIPGILLGREIFLAKYSEFAFRSKYDPIALAADDGYRLWGELGGSESKEKTDMELRLEFLKEYFRRIETTNLVTSANFKERLIARGEKVQSVEYGDHFFITALNRYYQYGEKLNEKYNDKETGEVLNSTKKLLWRKMHGLR